jgi:protein-tyrosine phosphatase
MEDSPAQGDLETVKSETSTLDQADASSASTPLQLKANTSRTNMDDKSTKLIMCMSRLTDWPLKEMVSTLVRLELSYNDLTTIPSCISALDNLETLIASSNLITTVEEGGITELKALKTLNLDANRLGSVFPGLSQMTSLTHLSLAKNRLSSFDRQILSLESLETLDLSNNPNIAGVLPDDMDFPHLTRLSIREIGLKEIPDTFAGLTSIRVLELDCNSLTDWPSEKMATLVHLERLELMLNDFNAIIPVESIDRFPKLVMVDMVGCDIDLSHKPAVPRRFRLGSCHAPSSIVPQLYLGNIESAYNKHKLRDLGVTHVLSIFESLPPYPDRFQYKVVELPDLESSNLYEHFESAVAFIDGAVFGGTSCLVHCHAGISRSSTMVICWLMKRYLLRYNDALSYVREKRPIIQPNPAFEKQLQQWESELAKTLKLRPPGSFPDRIRNSPSSSREQKCTIS